MALGCTHLQDTQSNHIFLQGSQSNTEQSGAKLVPEVLENVTTKDQLELLEMNKISGFVGRARGTGRPTKKERRELDEFIEPAFFGDFDFDWDEDDDEEEDI